MPSALAGICLRPWFFRLRALKGVLASNQKMIEDMPINLPVLERAGPTVVDFLKGIAGEGKGEVGEIAEASSGDEVTVTSL